MITDAVEINTGHIQIHEKGFWENQSIDYAFVPDDDMLNMLTKDERIAAITKRVNAGALLRSAITPMPPWSRRSIPSTRKGSR